MKLIKLLSGLSTIGVVSLGLSPIASCSNNPQNKYSQLVLNTINKFIELDKIPRCTSQGLKNNLEQIRSWIKNQAIASHVNEDDVCVDDYGNMWFDVKATAGYENYNPLILQGHMDMVVDGLEESVKATTPIEAVVEWDKGIMHSKDYKTSLGADNGIALAIIFSLLQDSSFKHGPLRIIFTADEDSGMLGAAHINKNTPNLLKKMGKNFDGQEIKYLLNIDWEEVGQYGRSCMGSVTLAFGKKELAIQEETAFNNKYYIDIRGLLGGHSGVDLVKDRASADKCIYELLNSLIESNSNSIQLVKHLHLDENGKDISFARNQIVPYARIVFNTTLDKSVIETEINSCIDKWKKTYTGENWSEVKVNVSDYTSNDNYHLSSTQSSQFISTVGKNTKPNLNHSKSIYYGYEKDENGKILMSQNISPVTLKYDDKTKTFNATAVSQIRTKSTTLLNELIKYYKDIKLFDRDYDQASYYPAWECEENSNKMLKIIDKAYQDLSIQPKVVDAGGGIENAWWADCNHDLNLSAIGVTITDAHSKKETVDINTIEPILNVAKKIALAMK